MRHGVTGKELSRSTSHRRALRRNMAASLIQHGTIKTTDIKAKELRRFAERVITIAKKGTLAARRQVISMLRDRLIADDEGAIQEKTVVQKLFSEIAPRYANRPGGYTRIIRLSERRIGDGGKQVLLQLVEEAKPQAEQAAATGRRRRQSAKRAAAVEAAGKKESAKPQAAGEGESAEPKAE